MNELKVLFFVLIYLLIQVKIFSQTIKSTPEESKTNLLISASQAGGAPVFFKVNELGVPLSSPGKIAYKGEYFIREGILNFFSKAKSGKPLRLGFIGGSITKADLQYRCQAARYIQSMFPKVKMTGLNAGVSGTGSDLGACRVQEQLLAYKPDLVFVEFAVNGAFAPGVEGIIRQIKKNDPYTAICLLYTISTGQAEIYASGQTPENIKALEKIADHYGVPSVHLGVSIGILQKQGILLWKGNPYVKNQKIVFSRDGIHPLPAGGDLYAAAIARAFEGMKNNSGVKPLKYRMPPAIYPDNWEDAKMLDPRQFIKFSTGWKQIDPSKTESLQAFSPWFSYIMKAEHPNDSFSFAFIGDYFGIFDVGAPEVGKLIITVDGTKATDLPNSVTKIRNNRFNKFCNNRYRGQYVLFKVPPGKHTVTFKISSKIPDKQKILGTGQLDDISKFPEKYNQSVIYLGKLLIKGTPIRPE